jgi:hypothetical protein
MRVWIGVVTAVLLGTAAQAERKYANLVPGCESLDKSVLSAEEARRYCKWIVRYRASTPAVEEEREIDTALGELKAVETPLFSGNQSSVLAKRRSGEFVVVSLEKGNNGWEIVSIADERSVKTSVKTMKPQ